MTNNDKSIASPTTEVTAKSSAVPVRRFFRNLGPGLITGAALAMLMG